MASAQPQDPTLDISHHQHPHENKAMPEMVDETAYTRGNKSEDNTSPPPPFSNSHSKDIESGIHSQDKESTGDISRIGSITSNGGIYKKYKVFVHAFVFCLFTG